MIDFDWTIALQRELQLNGRLEGVVRACEKVCVAQCCGIDAFDFSPLHLASFLSAFSGTISPADILALEDEIDALVSEALASPPDTDGTICSIAGMNQRFTPEALQAFARQLKRGVRLAPRVLEYAQRVDAENE